MQYANQLQTERRQFTNSEIQNISELGEVLKRIRARLKSEGISIEDERKKLLERAK
jgi:hypothetical protein